jgi:hypothetical protein
MNIIHTNKFKLSCSAIIKLPLRHTLRRPAILSNKTA